MKTTELFVEQVLIGFMVLLVGALVFWGDVYAFALKRSDKSLDLIVIGGILIAAAYLIGMVYDRIADTLLQDIEAHGRLHFALNPFKLSNRKIRTATAKLKDDDDGDVKVFKLTDRKDPFEEGKYRIRVLSNGYAAAQMDYLRTRLRLTRAMATIIPALMLAILLGVDNGDAGVSWTSAALSIPIVYAATLFLKALKSKKTLFRRPPKTNQLQKVNAYIGRAGMLPEDPRPAWRPSQIIAADEIWIGLVVLTLAGVVLVLETGIYELLWILVIGLVLTIVVGWTWWRISMTFYSFVSDFTELNKPASQNS